MGSFCPSIPKIDFNCDVLTDMGNQLWRSMSTPRCFSSHKQNPRKKRNWSTVHFPVRTASLAPAQFADNHLSQHDWKCRCRWRFRSKLEKLRWFKSFQSNIFMIIYKKCEYKSWSPIWADSGTASGPAVCTMDNAACFNIVNFWNLIYYLRKKSRANILGTRIYYV